MTTPTTSEHLEALRMAYEEARQRAERALVRYDAARVAWFAASIERRDAHAAYLLAKRGIVREP